MRGRYDENGKIQQRLEPRPDGCTNTITTVTKDNLVLEKESYCLKYQRTEYAKKIRKQYESGEVKERRCNMREYVPREDGMCNTITTVTKDNYIMEVEKHNE